LSLSLFLSACAGPADKPAANTSVLTPAEAGQSAASNSKVVSEGAKKAAVAKVKPVQNSSSNPPVPEAAAAPPLQLKDLPLSLAGDWTLSAGGAHSSDCYLMSKHVKIRDGHGGGKLRLLVDDGKMLLISTSNIDMSYSDAGFSFGGGDVLPLESLYSETAVLVASTYAALLANMQSNSIMTVRLGFWPSWPVTKSYQARIEMEGFTPALSQLQACNALL